MQNFKVYKIFETINNNYFYVISHVDDPDIVFMQFEHTSANKPNEPLYKYLNTAIGWDNIGIEKCDDIKPIDVINGVYGTDPKCMLTIVLNLLYLKRRRKNQKNQKKKRNVNLNQRKNQNQKQKR